MQDLINCLLACMWVCECWGGGVSGLEVTSCQNQVLVQGLHHKAFHVYITVAQQ